jgi:DNA (cytosine-5)-methyltransferase 1
MNDEAPTCVVRGQGHPGFETTLNHPFFAAQRERYWDKPSRRYRFRIAQPEWRVASEMNGMFWATPTMFADAKIEVPPVGGRGVKFIPEFWWMVGRWLGDGTLRLRQAKHTTPRRKNRSPRPYPASCDYCGGLASRNARYRHLANYYCSDACKNKAEAVSNDSRGSSIQICCSFAEAADLEKRLKFSTPKSTRAGFGEYRWSKRELRTAALFDCPHNGLALWLLEHFGQHATGKTIPAWALTMPEEWRRQLMEGYVSADGWQDHRKSEIVTVSKSLAIGIRLLAASLGYQANLHFTKARQKPIEGRHVVTHDQWRVVWIRKRQHEYGHWTDQHVWLRVNGIQPASDLKRVYNLSVADDESYTADGIVVHNCTHHSKARGGKPRNDQSRASAWHVLRWMSALYVDQVLIENVPDFLSWGPLGADSLPLKSAKGTLFQAFLQTIRDMKYVVEYRVLNCADYGAPQTRERLFIQGVRGRRKIVWPEPTHSRDGAPTLFGAPKPWRTAREIIDWSIPGQSIFTRKKPLVRNTMQRIFAGLEKFCGMSFLLPNEGIYRGNAPRSLGQPVPAVTSRGAGALVEPFLVKFYGGHDACSLDAPLPSVTANYEHYGLAQPFLLSIRGGNDGYARRNHSLKRPVPTITGSNVFALVEPFLLKYNGTGGGARALDDPVNTITAVDRFGLVEIEITLSGKLQTIAGIPVVFPDGTRGNLDIRFRMLTQRELARAQAFPDSYQFLGTRKNQTQQIGNAVPPVIAEALALAMLTE